MADREPFRLGGQRADTMNAMAELENDELDTGVDGGDRRSAGVPVRARAAVRPLDAAFVVCAAATIVLWSADVSFLQLAVIAVGWCVAWATWAARRPLTVWAPLIAAAVTITIWSENVPEIAFATSRGCLDDIADIELAGGVDDWSDIRRRNVWTAGRYRTGTDPGRCGLIRWRDTYVVEVDTASGRERAVVFVAAGQSHHLGGLTDVVQHGLVRVDGGPPATCNEVADDSGVAVGARCDIGDLGGGWYWFSKWWASGAN